MDNKVLLAFLCICAIVSCTSYTFGFTRGVSFFKRSADAYFNAIKNKFREQVEKEIRKEFDKQNSAMKELNKYGK